jgi:hypothetical protein
MASTVSLGAGVERRTSPFLRRLLGLVLLYSLVVAALPHVLDEPSIRLALRLQARLSFVLFVAALAGPGVRRLWPSRFGDVLVRERSSLLVGFGVSHLIHGIWIAIFFAFTPHVFRWNLTDGSGAVAFAFIALLVFAELPVGRRLFGARLVTLERVVLGYVWIQFTGFFVMRTQSGAPELMAWYVFAVLSSVAALALAWIGARPSGGPKSSLRTPAFSPETR